MSYGNVALRENTIESSKLFQGICSTDGFCPSNASGQSVGLLDDEFKAGGGRLVLEKICSGGFTCVPNDNGPWQFSGTAAELKGQLGQQVSPLGGVQGGPGQMFGHPYSPGSFLDRVTESYAGPHDFFNSGYWYDKLGNGIAPQGMAGYFGEALNAFNVIPATPFAVAINLSPSVFDALSVRPRK